MADRYCFTFLRDPIDRLISLYAFCAARPEDTFPLYAAARRMSLEEFLRLGDKSPYREALWNNQVWQLASGYGGGKKIDDLPPRTLLRMAKQNLKAFDHVGFVDTFDRDIVSILGGLGVDEPRKLAKHNASENKPVRAALPASTMKLLIGLTKLDRRLYRHARLRYQALRPLLSRMRRSFSRAPISAASSL